MYVCIFINFTVYAVFLYFHSMHHSILYGIYLFWESEFLFLLKNSTVLFLIIKVVCFLLKRIQNSERHKEDNKK